MREGRLAHTRTRLSRRFCLPPSSLPLSLYSSSKGPLMLAQQQQHAFQNPYEAQMDDTDAASAALIAQLMQQDAEDTAGRYAAEELALKLALVESRPGSPIEVVDLTDETNDRVVALRLAADSAAAQAFGKEGLQENRASAANATVARQLEQQLAAQR